MHSKKIMENVNLWCRRMGVLSRLPGYALSPLVQKKSLSPTYISEGRDWVIKDIGDTLALELSSLGISLRTTTSTRFLSHSLIHYGSLHMFLTSTPRNSRFQKSSNKVITTFFHGRLGLEPALDESIRTFQKRMKELDHLVVSNTLVRNRVLEWGFPSDRVTLIPIGFHADRFGPVSPFEKAQLRLRLGIPENVFCIGSFQKDSEGWGESVSPKLVKGPDVFVEVLSRLIRKRPVMALLTGPARGYVKSELEKNKVPYVHHFLSDPTKLREYYGALDAYLISSREEGGPIAIMESLKCGIPLVTTRVGMAVDVLNSSHNAFVVEVDDVEALENALLTLMDDPTIVDRFRTNGLKSVDSLSWATVARKYADLYRKLIEG